VPALADQASLIPSPAEDGLALVSVGGGYTDTLMLVDTGLAPLIWDMVTHTLHSMDTHIMAPLIPPIDLTRLILIKM